MTMSDDAGDVTVLLQAWSDGDRVAGDRLFAIIYGELRQLAGVQLRRSSVPITIQATEVIHEAYFRLARQHTTDWKNRAHFYAIAATVMRRILLDYARLRLAGRRDRRQEAPLDAALGVSIDREVMSFERADELLQIDEALEELAAEDPRRARVVELRYFAGLGIAEVARLLDISEPTVKRDWALARAWLRTRLGGSDLDPGTAGD